MIDFPNSLFISHFNGSVYFVPYNSQTNSSFSNNNPFSVVPTKNEEYSKSLILLIIFSFHLSSSLNIS